MVTNICVTVLEIDVNNHADVPGSPGGSGSSLETAIFDLAPAGIPALCTSVRSCTCDDCPDDDDEASQTS